jgi:hypothetical protein
MLSTTYLHVMAVSYFVLNKNVDIELNANDTLLE